MLEIIEIKDITDIKNDFLRARAEKARNCRSHEFACISNGVELAFISIENISHSSYIIVYEIFVLPEYRSRGAGSALLLHAESFASRIGYCAIQLRANAFDRTMSFEWLVAWYASKGYVQNSPGSEYMGKILPSTLA